MNEFLRARGKGKSKPMPEDSCLCFEKKEV